MLRTPILAAAFLLALVGLIPETPQAAEAGFQQPNAYAVVIGISQYREEIIPKVEYAVRDAEAVADLLEAQGGIPKAHIRLLTDSKATGNDLRSVVDWLRIRVNADSTVYVYYAGHGTPNPQTGDAYLVPWDGHPDYPGGLYPLKDLYGTLNALPTKDVIVILDSCFSGMSGRSVLAKDTRPMIISMENPLLPSGKVIVLAASTGNQVSSDYAKGEHGLFTYYLLAGLQGEADTDHDKMVTLRELAPYVRERVAHTAVEELNREQTPVLFPREETLGTRVALPLSSVTGNPEKLPPHRFPSPSKFPSLAEPVRIAILEFDGPSSDPSTEKLRSVLADFPMAEVSREITISHFANSFESHLQHIARITPIYVKSSQDRATTSAHLLLVPQILMVKGVLDCPWYAFVACRWAPRYAVEIQGRLIAYNYQKGTSWESPITIAVGNGTTTESALWNGQDNLILKWLDHLANSRQLDAMGVKIRR